MMTDPEPTHDDRATPFDRIEMDAPMLDLVLIDEGSQLVLGRPVVTLCIDEYTRTILGIHVGLEDPAGSAFAHEDAPASH